MKNIFITEIKTYKILIVQYSQRIIFFLFLRKKCEN